MFILNFKKDWNNHKSMLISFFVVSIFILALITGFYFIIEYVNLSTKTETVMKILWSVIAGIATLLGTILPIILMFVVLKSDLGKRNVHNTIFTPQPIISWFLPKVIFVFIVQGLFAFIQLGYAYLIIEVTGQKAFNTAENINLFLISTFQLSYFGIITLSMAIYYSLRKKGLAWSLIGAVILGYFGASIAYSVIAFLNHIDTQSIKAYWIQYGIISGLGIFYILISLMLFEKKLEY